MVVKKVNVNVSKWNKAGGWFVVIFFICLLGLFAFNFLFPGYIGSSNGQETGTIVAVEYNSNLVWSANLVYVKTSARSSQEDVYCVNDESIKQKVKSFSQTHEPVTVYYKNNYIMWKWQCNGGSSIIYNVEKSSTPLAD
jgi:hypothetical protein